MSNHFHLVTRMYPEDHLSDDQIRERLGKCFPEGREISEQTIAKFRERWSSLAKFIKDIKLGFTRYYNKRHNRTGYFWGERFKSLIVQNGHSLVNLLAYVWGSPRSMPQCLISLASRGSRKRAIRDESSLPIYSG